MLNIQALQDQILQAKHEIKHLNNPELLHQLIKEIAIKATNADNASLWRYNAQDALFINVLKPELKISMRQRKGLFYQCFSSNKATLYNNITSESGYVNYIDNLEEEDLKSKIYFPLNAQGNFLGIVTVSINHDNNNKFTTNDLEILKAIHSFLVENLFIDRRVAQNTDNGFRRRRDDIIANLNSLQESQEAVQKPHAMIDSISNIVHDIRTPANGLYGFLEILEEQIQDTRLKEYIKHAKESAHLINELTTSILDGVSTQTEPMASTESKSTNTVKFFSDIAEVFSANMSKKNIQYNIFIDPLLPKEILLQTMKLKRVIMNLISNASKFTPQNGSIEFSVRYKQKEKKLHIFVKDSGIGIAKDKQTKIFEAFQQAEESTKELYGGTGLGLSICAAYVKELGGKLLLESEPNKGSTFYFDLPMDITDYAVKFKTIKDDKSVITIVMNKENSFVANHIARYFVKIGMDVDKINAVANLSLVPANTTHLITFEKKLTHEIFTYVKHKKVKHLIVEENFLTLKSSQIQDAMIISQYSYFGEALYSFANQQKIPKVLIVEDDAISVSLIKSMLEEEYCDIDTASNGEEGFEFLHRAFANNNPYCIVYSDQNMPKLSGSDMIRKYKKLELKKQLQKTRFAYISGDICKEKDTILFDYFLNKPFKKKEICELLTQLTE